MARKIVTGKRVIKSLVDASARNRTFVGLNLDPMPSRLRSFPSRMSLEEFAFVLVDSLSPLVVAVKINTQHLLLGLSPRKVKKLVSHIHSKGIIAISDHKLADIGNTNRVALHYILGEMGFDGITVHPHIGFKSGLSDIIDVASSYDAAVFPVVYMSHEGAQDFYELETVRRNRRPLYRRFVDMTVEKGLTGMVIGATQPKRLMEIIQYLADNRHPQIVLSVGYGEQKGRFEKAKPGLLKGRLYPFYGRSAIYAYDDPHYRHLGFPEACIAAAKEFRDEINRRMK